jgi:hypothetical protein
LRKCARDGQHQRDTGSQMLWVHVLPPPRVASFYRGTFIPLLLHEHPSSACNTSTSRLPRSSATLGAGGQRGRLSISEKSRNAFVLFLILLKATVTLSSISVVRDKLVVQRHVLTEALLNEAVFVTRSTPGPVCSQAMQERRPGRKVARP